MAKILLLTTLYPATDIKISNNTSVVHYFAKEWVKMGHEVVVVHNYPIYLRFLHFIAGSFDKLIASSFNTNVTVDYQRETKQFELDGVKVYRIPLYKPFPRMRLPKRSLSKQIDRIISICNTINFVPDAISAHNFYPHLEMVNELKQFFHGHPKSCLVIHKQRLGMLNYVKDFKKELSKIDSIGFRSLAIKNEFVNYTGITLNRLFLCYSGISPEFQNQIPIKISTPITKFIYVGALIKRKYSNKVLASLSNCNIDNFHLSIVGDGVLKGKLESQINQLRLINKVKMLGRVPRNVIPSLMKEAQCFIMISKDETFGLVYIEAMAIGLITIASRGEGVDGIIVDGVNGFLCEAGNEQELTSIINRINSMPISDLQKISRNARETALALTDTKVAKSYINNILFGSN